MLVEREGEGQGKGEGKAAEWRDPVRRGVKKGID